MLDRFIQQAVMQVLQRRWDRTFSEHSYGFRPGRSAQQAVALPRLEADAHSDAISTVWACKSGSVNSFIGIPVFGIFVKAAYGKTVRAV